MGRPERLRSSKVELPHWFTGTSAIRSGAPVWPKRKKTVESYWNGWHWKRCHCNKSDNKFLKEVINHIDYHRAWQHLNLCHPQLDCMQAVSCLLLPAVTKWRHLQQRVYSIPMDNCRCQSKRCVQLKFCPNFSRIAKSYIEKHAIKIHQRCNLHIFTIFHPPFERIVSEKLRKRISSTTLSAQKRFDLVWGILELSWTIFRLPSSHSLST